jgi:deoxyribose-phosphate aldolase
MCAYATSCMHMLFGMGILLHVCEEHNARLRVCLSGDNLQPAGGVKTAADAKVYLDLADNILGPEWANSGNFRFGASSLRPALLSTLQGGDGVAASGY